MPAQLRGIQVHALFAIEVDAAFGPGHAEVTYLNGSLATYGALGSSRADAVVGDPDHPIMAVDLQTGNAQMTRGQLNRYGRNLPAGTPVVILRGK
jgi:hypothetical protein